MGHHYHQPISRPQPREKSHKRDSPACFVVVTTDRAGWPAVIQASLRATSPIVAESFAKAMAIRKEEREPKNTVILLDSREACSPYLKGRITAASEGLIGSKITHHHRVPRSRGPGR